MDGGIVKQAHHPGSVCTKPGAEVCNGFETARVVDRGRAEVHGREWVRGIARP